MLDRPARRAADRGRRRGGGRRRLPLDVRAGRRAVAPLLRALLDGATHTIGELCALPDVTVDRAAVRALLADLVSHGLLAAR